MNTFDLRNALCQCSNCGKIYPSTLRFGRGYFNGKDQDVRKLTITWACPICGQENLIRVELVEEIEKAIEAIQQMPIEVLLSLKNKISEKSTVPYSRADFQELKSDVFSKIPALKVLEFLKSKNTKENINTFGVIFTIILETVKLLQGEQETIHIDKYINQTQNIKIYNSYPKELNSAQTKKGLKLRVAQKDNPLKKIDKKAPCPCGSGKPYGKCHGRRVK